MPQFIVHPGGQAFIQALRRDFLGAASHLRQRRQGAFGQHVAAKTGERQHNGQGEQVATANSSKRTQIGCSLYARRMTSGPAVEGMAAADHAHSCSVCETRRSDGISALAFGAD